MSFLVPLSLPLLATGAQFSGENMCTAVIYKDDYGNPSEFYCNPSEYTKCEYRSKWLGAMEKSWAKYYWAECHCLRYKSERSCTNDESCLWRPELVNDPDRKHPCRGNMQRPTGVLPTPQTIDLGHYTNDHDSAFLIYTERIRKCWTSYDQNRCESYCLEGDYWHEGSCKPGGGGYTAAHVYTTPPPPVYTTPRPVYTTPPPQVYTTPYPIHTTTPKPTTYKRDERDDFFQKVLKSDQPMCYFDPKDRRCKRNIQTECLALDRYLPALQGDFRNYYAKMCECAEALSQFDCEFFSFGNCEWRGEADYGFCTTKLSLPSGPVDWDLSQVHDGMRLARDVLSQRDLACASARSEYDCKSYYLLYGEPWYERKCSPSDLPGAAEIECREGAGFFLRQ